MGQSAIVGYFTSTATATMTRWRRRIFSRRGPFPRPLVCPDDRTLTDFSGLLPLLRFLSPECA